MAYLGKKYLLNKFQAFLYKSAPRVCDACAFASRLTPHASGPSVPQCASRFFKLRGKETEFDFPAALETARKKLPSRVEGEEAGEGRERKMHHGREH